MSKPFVIMFTARSGSTALYGQLRKHPDIVMRAEVFGAKTLPDDVEQTDDNRVRFLRKFWAPFKGGATPSAAPWRGFKWQVDRKNTQFSKPRRLLKIMGEYDPRIIVLRRENILKQAISAINARRLLQATEDSDKPSAHVTIENVAVLERLKSEKLRVDIAELNQVVNGIRRSKHRLDLLASEIVGPKKEVRYEDYVASPQEFMTSLCEFIGVDPLKIGSQAYVKITSDNLIDVVENYDDVQRFVRGRDLESML
jgi:LPS sulfotransferase NodH